MSREEAQEIVESLYGLDMDDISEVIEELGFEALSDEALVMLAERQQARERMYCRQEALTWSAQ